MVPRYVRIKKLPAKHKQPHVSEGLQRVGGRAAGQRGSSSKQQQGAACGWQTHSGSGRLRSRDHGAGRGPGVAKHDSPRPWEEPGQARASASVEWLISGQPGSQRLLGCQLCPGNRKLAPVGPGKETMG